MKKTRLLALLMLVVICFTSCGKSGSADLGDTYVEGTDYQYMYSNQPMAEGPDGYYYRANDFIYYIDKQTMKPYALCGKPNCLHQFEPDPLKVTGCDAYFKSDLMGGFLAYQDGYLYVTAHEDPFSPSSDVLLFRLKPDGTERKSVLTIPRTASEYIIHRGYLYYNQNIITEDLKTAYGIYRQPLNGGKEEMLYQGMLDGGKVSNFSAYGNYIYFSESGTKDKLFFTYPLCYNTQTEKTKRLIECEEDADPMPPDFINDRLLIRVYHWRDQENPQETRYYEYFTADLDGNHLEKISPLAQDAAHGIMTDRHDFWRYTIPWEREKEIILQKIDQSGNVIAELSDPSYGNQAELMPGNEKYLFYSDIEENLEGQEDDEFVLYYIDKQPEDGVLRKQECLRMNFRTEYLKSIVKEN